MLEVFSLSLSNFRFPHSPRPPPAALYNYAIRLSFFSWHFLLCTSAYSGGVRERSPTFWKFWQLGTDCPFVFPGGRTAWTARVLVNWNLYQARFFYDGDRNAREDAAEVALYHLTPKIHAAASQSYSGRLYPYEYDLHERQWPMTQELKRYEKHYYY